MKKILVIEDTKSVREEIVAILGFEDFDVVEAENGREGLQKARKYQPDLIVCDILMPEMDGHTVLTKLRQDPVVSTTPFIFLTAKSTREDLRDGMELGADDYIIKPFTSEQLVTAIRTRLGKHELIVKHNESKFEALCQNIVYALPHEFITPLTAILGFSELLLDTSNDPENRRIAEGIHSSAKRFERLVKNFLIYAQIEVMINNPQKISAIQNIFINNPGSIIKDVIFQKAKASNRASDFDVKVKNVPVQISTENLKKIVEELVDNAIKFSAAGTNVKINAYADKDFFIIEVTDKGRGMTEEQIRNIDSYMQFERKFYEQQGLGLGLVIAKRLVELHDGVINIDSELDKGTKVEIKLRANPLATNISGDEDFELSDNLDDSLEMIQ